MENELVQPVVGWFSLSLIISGIAQAMNRDGFDWWLLGIIFGPLALFCLVAFVGVKVEDKNSSEEIEVTIKDGDVD